MTARPETARIDRARAALAGSLESSTARPASRRWAMENFQRGLRLGRELQDLVGPLAGKRLLEIGTAYGGDLTALHALGVSCIGTDHVVMNFPDLRRRLGDPPDFSFVRVPACGAGPLPTQASTCCCAWRSSNSSRTSTASSPRPAACCAPTALRC